MSSGTHLALIIALVATGCGGGSGSARDHADAHVPDAGPADDGAVGADDGAVGADAHADAAAPGDMGADDDGGAPEGLCEGSYGAPETTGHLAERALVEVSGIAPSRTSPGVLWMNNDNQARVFAARTDGSALGVVTFDDVQTEDTEDVDLAACPNGQGDCLWLADTGTNNGDRKTVSVYVVPEPAVDGPFGVRASGPVRKLPFRYPGEEVVDSEAIAVAPDGKSFWVFEKVDGPRARVWRHPGPMVHDRRVELELVATLDSPGFSVPKGRMITGADLHDSGERLLVRVYTGTYEFRLGPGQSLADLGDLEPRTVAVGPLTEPQGEAVSYDAEGTGVWTVSEDPMGEGGQPLHHYGCL